MDKITEIECDIQSFIGNTFTLEFNPQKDDTTRGYLFTSGEIIPPSITLKNSEKILSNTCSASYRKKDMCPFKINNETFTASLTVTGKVNNIYLTQDTQCISGYVWGEYKNITYELKVRIDDKVYTFSSDTEFTQIKEIDDLTKGFIGTK